MKNFALLGVGGFIAPRHLAAIKATGNRLEAALDPSDSVGILDSYFPDASFFTEFERFDRHCEKLRKRGRGEEIHYVTVCSPNYLHDSHIRFALRIGAHVICEKPLVLHPRNLDALAELSAEYHRTISPVLQLRLHPGVIEFRERIQTAPRTKPFEVALTYVTARGRWYDYSWKGTPSLSGGLAANLGTHFFDLLIHLFGAVRRSDLHSSSAHRMAGFLELERANVSWLLSTLLEDVPEANRDQGHRAYRSLQVEGEEINLSESFQSLHTRVYEEVLADRGVSLEEVRPSVELLHGLSHQKISLESGILHPFLQRSRN